MTSASNLKILRISSLMLIVMLLCTFTFGKVIYVDDDAAGANDGSSWTDACACLQNALIFAQQGDEIRVAQGIYKPDQQVLTGRDIRVVESGDRTVAFQLIDGVDIKGGYAGSSGPDPNERDISLYETILSGDLNGDDNEVNDPCDLLTEPTRAENSYSVVTGAVDNSLLDGFTISGGNANGSLQTSPGAKANPSEYGWGGGIHLIPSSVTINNCTFKSNAASGGGGGIFCVLGNGPTLNNCIFARNSGGSVVRENSNPYIYGGGGGMYSQGNRPTLTNCTFIANFAPTDGGGMYNIDCNATLINCIFTRNSSGIVVVEGNSAVFINGAGGGMYNNKCNATLTNCIFTANVTKERGGGMESTQSNITLTNCTFSGNLAYNDFFGSSGGGINSLGDDIIILTNCTFAQNFAQIGNALCDDNLGPSDIKIVNCILWGGGEAIWHHSWDPAYDSTITITYSNIQGGWPGEGGYNINTDPLFVDADGPDNVIGTEDDDLRLLPDSPCIDAGDNSAIPESVVTDAGGNPRIVNGTVDIGAYEFSIRAIPDEIKYGGGTGEPNDPYLIYTAEQMNAIGTKPNDWDKHFKLMADIDLSVLAGDSYQIIGTEDQPFEGMFDGNDHCISNFSFSGDLRIGLFGVADKGARIMNIVLVNPNVRGTKYVGTLVGELKEATVVHCKTQGGTISKPSDSSGQCGFFGGLIGRNATGIVTACQATCDIAAERSKYVGGLVGENMGIIQDCSATGAMGDVHTPTEYFVGALVGFNGHKKGIISGCYATGNVYYEESYAGGLVGMNMGGIFDCYATGNIFYTSSDKYEGNNAGGLVGGNCGAITHCVAMGDISGRQSIGGLVGINGGVWDKEQFIQSYGNLGFDWGNITDCYATGAAIGTECVGGLVGSNYETVSRCYATGPVSGGEYGVGGCIGMNSQMFEDSTTAGTIIACFWDIETSGQSSSAGDNGVVGKTTAEMQTSDTFLEVDWDFIDETTIGTEDIWKITEGLSYPQLWWEKYGGGTGEPNDPYLIYTDEQLNTIGLNEEDADKHFKLMADIDLSAYQGDSFNRIGFYDPPEFAPDWHPPFEGVFDGNNHTISNFTYVIDVNEPLKENGLWSDEYVGLFGVVSGEQAQIKNLGLIDPNIHPAETCSERVTSVGAIAGELRLGSITNCYVEGGRISADISVGGLVGSNEGTISNCYTTCDVTWANGRWLRPLDLLFELVPGSFGGLVGFNRGQISDCYTTGSIQGYNSSGGLIGHNYCDMFDPNLDCGVISNCSSTGDVSGNEYVGGLTGENSGEINQCLAAGNVSGLNKVGGLVGNIGFDEGSISGSYATGDVSGDEEVGGLVGYSNGLTQDSYATGEVSGTMYVGGLTGFNGSGTINRSYASGAVSGSENVGGLVGRNGKGIIDYCYAKGEVLGTTYVGGLAGTNFSTIHCCYAANAVSGIQEVGGLVGDNWGSGATIITCLWDIETSALTDMCGIQRSGAIGCDDTCGKTTIEMQTASTFLDTGWDFVDETANGTEDIWWIDEGQDYPRLCWEISDETSP